MGCSSGQGARLCDARGITLVEALFQTIDPITGELVAPRLVVTEDCPVLIEELEKLPASLAKLAGERDPGEERRSRRGCPSLRRAISGAIFGTVISGVYRLG